jgi:hypothetical protein
MIYDIRLNGFDRIRLEIEEKMRLKKEIENNISSLENTLKHTRNSSKMNITEYKNLIREIDTMTLLGDVKINFN